MKIIAGKYKLWRKGIILTLSAVIAVVAAYGVIFAKSTEPNAAAASLFGSSYSANKTVPVANFASALAQALKLKPSKKTKCYADISKTANAQEICALKAAKIFPNVKKIFPNSKVTFEFALGSLCKAKNWTEKKTYKACLSYAKKQKFLTAPLPSKTSKKKKLTYRELAVLIERSIPIETTSPGTTSQTTEPELPEPETPLPPAPALPPPPTNVTIPPRPTTPLTFTPVAGTQIASDFFSNIRLSSSLSNRFHKDEIYFVEGDVIGMNADEVFIFLCREGQGCDDSINFIENASSNHFKIPVHFSQTGNFQIGIIPGRAGESKITDISVLPEPENLGAGGRQATSMAVKYESGKTIFSWNGEGSLTRLVIAQNNKRKDYLFRQGARSFTPDSKDFEGFLEGWAVWQVMQEGAASDMQNIYLVKQELRKIETDKIQIKSLTETYAAAPAVFTFSGHSLVPVAKKAAITLPNGSVEEFNISENDLPKDQDFTVERNFTSMGTYIFEINDPQGGALINVPIYVGSRVPLLPDFFALDETTLNTLPINDLNRERQKLLLLINTDRAVHSLPAVTLSDELNNLAQGHSQNMINLKFFGHINPAGESPDDRRKQAKITTPIRENLGKATNPESVEAGLMRSPIHRAAILDPEMQRVGLGIAKDTEGYFIVTQNFAGNPLNQTELTSIEASLVTQAKTYRSQNGLLDIERDALLDRLAGEWSLRMATENFFGVSDKAGDKLLDKIREEGVTSAIQIHIAQVSDKKQLAEELLKQSALAAATNRKIGLGLRMNEIGELFLTTIYTP